MAYTFDELVAVDQHVFVQILMALFLVEFELKFVVLHRGPIQSFERGAKVAIDIRLLITIPRNNTSQLPNFSDSIGLFITLLG